MKTEQLLKQQAEMQLRLYEAMPCGILRYTAGDELRLVSVNQTGCRMFGCSGIDEFFEMVGDNVFAPLCAESQEEQLVALEKLKNGASIMPFSCRAKRRDGSTFWIEGYSSLTESEDGEPLVQAAFNDVSHQRLERQERDIQRYADVLCSVYDEVIEYDCVRKLCRVIYSAHANSLETGSLPLDEALDRWMKLIPDYADRVRLREAIDACASMSERKPITCTYRLVFEDHAT